MCTCPAEVLLLLKSSDFIGHDLSRVWVVGRVFYHTHCLLSSLLVTISSCSLVCLVTSSGVSSLFFLLPLLMCGLFASSLHSLYCLHSHLLFNLLLPLSRSLHPSPPMYSLSFEYCSGEEEDGGLNQPISYTVRKNNENGHTLQLSFTT